MTDFNQVVNRYGTYSTQWDYVQDRFGEEALLPFSISDMDFAIPAGTKEVLANAVTRGVFGYTRWNHPDFKGAISRWFDCEFNCEVDEEWIVFSPSVIYSLSILIQLLGKGRNKVVTFTPCYDAFFNTIRENAGELFSASLKKNDGHFEIDFADLENLFETEKPEIFLLCNPHNPTGRAFTLAELTRLIELCNQYQVAIISDEIHMDIRRPGISHHPILALYHEIEVPVVLLSSASKTFNTPGLGCSYGLIPAEALREEFLTILKARDGLSSAPYLGMIALQDCYNNEKPWLAELNRYVDQNFQYVLTALENHPHIDCYLPETTYLAWLEVKDLPVEMDQLQDILVHEEKVAIMRGDTYGIEGRNYLRLNLGAPQSKIRTGVAALLRALEKSSVRSSQSVET